MYELKRRAFLSLSSAAGASWLAGCAAKQGGTTSVEACQDRSPIDDFVWLSDEQLLVEASRDDFDVVVRGGSGSGVLRARARSVPPKLDLSRISERMEKTMGSAGGVGIAGPQVGLYLRVATLMLDYKSETPKTIFVRNPVIVDRSDVTIDGYEGCLSIPDVGGMVRRNRWIKVEHNTFEGETITVEAEDYNAILWQHELDHLDGILYVDKLLGELLPMDEVRRRREEMGLYSERLRPVLLA
ncbi:MAG: peptide deformylase [Deltaproteobacteria bacterium]|nr:peptide deformylase [Deltaproteobacteria bacterium]